MDNSRLPSMPPELWRLRTLMRYYLEFGLCLILGGTRSQALEGVIEG
jgi:hypothetical protein